MIKKERKKKGTNNHQVKTKRVRSVLFVLKEGFLFLRGNNTLGQGTLAAEKPQAQSHSQGQPPSQLGTSGQSTTGNSPC